MKSDTILYNSREHSVTPVLKAKLIIINMKANGLQSLTEKVLPVKDIIVIKTGTLCTVQVTVDKTTEGVMQKFFDTLRSMDELQRRTGVTTVFSLFLHPNSNYMENNLTMNYFNQKFCFQENKEEAVVIFSGKAGAFFFEANGKMLPPERVNDFAEMHELTSKEKAHLADLKKNCEIVGVHRYDNESTGGLFGISSFIKRQKRQKEQASFNSQARVPSLNLTQQEMEIFNPKILKLQQGSKFHDTELSELIGLDNVKNEILKLKAKLTYRKRQRKRGIFISDAENLHMCFTGEPGTGKTTVARQITGILYDLGYIKENSFIEVNAQNLKGGYSGQTAIITKCVLKSAKNKVLFIDEAYALYDKYENGFGKEAIATILKYLEDERDNTVIIFAGYKQEMQDFLRMNEGLKSRINRHIDFENYSPSELIEILLFMLKKKKLFITEEALEECYKTFKKETKKQGFANARFVRNFLEQVEFEHAYRIGNGRSGADVEDTITVDDLCGYKDIK